MSVDNEKQNMEERMRQKKGSLEFYNKFSSRQENNYTLYYVPGRVEDGGKWLSGDWKVLGNRERVLRVKRKKAGATNRNARKPEDGERSLQTNDPLILSQKLESR